MRYGFAGGKPSLGDRKMISVFSFNIPGHPGCNLKGMHGMFVENRKDLFQLFQPHLHSLQTFSAIQSGINNQVFSRVPNDITIELL